ncbi:MAG: acetyl ornithine aminotransferase family protein [Ardenticatenales bacterium]|nr:acetyl ornithine aminotransferase family protein [Ardenticatenales bacterium]
MTNSFTHPEFKTELPGPNVRALLARDHEVISPSYTRGYPFAIDRGRGAWVWDIDDNRFLDLTAGIAVTNLGHCHPKVNAAIHEQVDKFLHMSGTDFYYRLQVETAEALARITPGDGQKLVFFTNSGTESIEAAMKLARRHTQRPKIMAFIGSFHGRTYGSMTLSSSKPIHREGFGPLVEGVHHVPYGAPIESYYDSLFRYVDPKEFAAVFVEPMQGEGGYVLPPEGWMQSLRAFCDEHGILLVADEVQSGMGRTGQFFAMDHYGVVPDITCIAKGIANGLPLGAIVAKAEVMDWPSGSHANTFGGNPVACAAAMAVIQTIEEEGLLQNALNMGDRLQTGLKQLAQEHETIKEVRGLGLMVGAEMQDPATGGHAKKLRDHITDVAYEEGLLILGAGPSTIRFLPPINVSAAEVDLSLDLFAHALNRAERDKGYD